MKKIALSLLCLLAAFGFTACGGGGGQKLVFLHWEDALNQKYFEPIFAEFKKRHPGVKIDSQQAMGGYTQKLNALMAAGTPPDIFYLQANTYLYYAAKGELEPMNGYFAKDSEIDIKKFFPSVRAAMTWRTNVYFLPKGCHTVCLFFNKDLFDSEGLPYPDESWTFDTMAAVAKKLTKDVDGDGKIDQFGFRGFQWLDIFATLYCYGGGIISEDGSRVICNSKQSIDALKYIYNTKYVMKISPGSGQLGMDGSGGSQVDPFQLGKIAMQLAIFATVFDLREKAPNLNFDVTMIPKGPAGRKTHLETTGFFISSRSAKKDLAWDLVKLLGGEMGTRIFAKVGRDMPAYNDPESIQTFLDPSKKPAHAKVFMDSLQFAFLQKYLVAPVLDQWSPQGWDQINTESIKKDPAKAMNDAYPAIVKAFNEFKTSIGETPVR